MWLGVWAGHSRGGGGRRGSEITKLVGASLPGSPPTSGILFLVISLVTDAGLGSHPKSKACFHGWAGCSRQSSFGAMEGPRATPQSYWDLGLEKIFRVVPALPEDGTPGPNPDTFRLELVIRAAIGFFTVLLFLWRSVQSVKTRLYVKKRKKLALKLSELIEDKCKLLDKVSLLQKEHEGLQLSFKDANPEKASKEVQHLEIIHEMLNRSKSKLEAKTLFLETELKEEKSERSE
ncbi:cTAGE family member 15 [Sciurus carolinensis]|uniref:CTAGE family member 15 n=1 Tax=Sciurus carolinensis TaxID=30640 RepID=A0AA41NH91_SCICA|nr:cTAGE family member 15 [Sciurus carolinensis]